MLNQTRRTLTDQVGNFAEKIRQLLGLDKTAR